LSLKTPRADLNQLNGHDSNRIQIAAKHFANEFAKQFDDSDLKETVHEEA